VGVLWHAFIANAVPREGNCNVPQSQKEDLGMWMSGQYTNKKNGTLGEDRKYKLIEIGVLL